MTVKLTIDIVYVPITDLNIDHEHYQRDQDMKRVRKIADNFDIKQFSPLSVSRRSDGSLWVWDGGHRFEAARLLGYSKVPCVIFDMSMIQEAIAFAEAQKGRKGLTQFDAHRALLAAGDPFALELDKIVEEAGFRIAQGASGRSLQCVAKLRQIHNHWGVLAETLQMITVLGWVDRGGKHANVLEGVARFIACAGESLDVERLAKRLASHMPASLLAPYATWRYGAAAVRHVAEVYNRGLKSTSPKFVNVEDCG